MTFNLGEFLQNLYVVFIFQICTRPFAEFQVECFVKMLLDNLEPQ